MPKGENRISATVMLFANTDWYLYNFRLSLAVALRDRGANVILVSPAGPYGEDLVRLGFRWVPAPMQRRSLNPLREARLLIWLVKLMLRERVDVVHSFTIKCAIYGSVAARLAARPARVNAITGLGYVFTSNDARAKILRAPVIGLMRRSLSGARARLILQNRDDLEFVSRLRLVRRDDVRIIAGSGVNCDRFRPSTRQRERGRFKVVLPARLLWDKGVGEFVAAAKILRAEGHDTEFLLAGLADAGNPAAVPDAILSDWENQGLVTILGHVADMSSLFRQVDAAVLPSYREGLPKGLIEAAASGLPIVATDVPGCRDVISHERDGLLVPSRDGRALADAIRRLQQDSKLRRQLGREARRKASRLFDERLIVAQTIEVYSELLEGR